MPSLFAFAAGASLLLATACPAYGSDLLRGTSSHGLLYLRSTDVLSRPYISVGRQPNIDDTDTLTRRDTSSANDTLDGVPLNDDGSLNLTAWDSATNDACMNQLKSLPQSSNPSGTCICYNLPSLDAASGTFAADLRLFRISQPRDDFAGTKQSEFNVSLLYSNADASRVSEDKLVSMGMMGMQRRADGSGGLELLKQYHFVGKIRASKMSNNMSMSALEALVMPVLTISALSPSGGKLATNVSSNEAAFLTGVFSKQAVLSDFGAAQIALDDAKAALKNGTAAFVLPGVQVMVLPIGPIITGVWMLVGLGVYGMGTIDRMRYAESYRRRAAMVASRTNTI